MIRRVRQGDGAALRVLCEVALGHKTTVELLEKRIEELAGQPGYHITVYEEKGEVLGFLQAGKYDLLYGERGWNIMALAVSPTARRRGIGRALVEELESWALKQGDCFVRLNSRVERAEAHQFYAALGYTCDKTQKRFIKPLGGGER